MKLLSNIKKRSVSLQNHKTSISLEKEFWIELKNASTTLGLSQNQLISKIDRQRHIGVCGLSSAVRIWILNWIKNQK